MSSALSVGLAYGFFKALLLLGAKFRLRMLGGIDFEFKLAVALVFSIDLGVFDESIVVYAACVTSCLPSVKEVEWRKAD